MAAPSIHHPKHGFRRPLQLKNIITPLPTTHHKKCTPNDYTHSNKENFPGLIPPIETIDASLAEELNAVRERMERLKADKDKTEKLLRERDEFLECKWLEFNEMWEFQKDLEIEVDRLFRLKELNLDFPTVSPIRSLREKEMEKNSRNGKFEVVKSGLKSVDESNATKSSSSRWSFETVSNASSSSASTSTITSKMAWIMPRLSSESVISNIVM